MEEENKIEETAPIEEALDPVEEMASEEDTDDVDIGEEDI